MVHVSCHKNPKKRFRFDAKILNKLILLFVCLHATVLVVLCLPVNEHIDIVPVGQSFGASGFLQTRSLESLRKSEN